MDRNKVIVRLSHALVVVEAGERGGSIAAGKEALSLGRAVVVCDLGAPTPAGSRTLLAAGARSIAPEHLTEALNSLPESQAPEESPGSLC